MNTRNQNRYLLIIIFCLSVITHTCVANKICYSDTLRPRIIKVNPWGIKFGSYNFQYEQFLDEDNSIELLINIKHNTKNSFWKNENKFPDLQNLSSGISVLFDYRHYSANRNSIKRKRYNYFSPFIKYTGHNFSLTGKYFIYSQKVDAFKAGFDWGTQKVYKKRIVLDIFMGPFLRYANAIYKSKDYYNLPWENDTYSCTIALFNKNKTCIGIGIRAGLNIGFCF